MYHYNLLENFQKPFVTLEKDLFGLNTHTIVTG